MITKIDHIGIAVGDLDRTINFFKETYGAELLWRKIFEGQQLESAFIKLGESQFELSMSTDQDGVIAKFIEQRGEGIHHISLRVDNIKSTIKKLKEMGMTLMGEASTNEFSVVFVHPKDNFGILIEIIERKEDRKNG